MKITAINQNLKPHTMGQKSRQISFYAQNKDEEFDYEKMSFRRREYLAKAICYTAALIGVLTSSLWFWRRAKKN